MQVLEELLGAGVPSDHRLTEQAGEADGAAFAHPLLAQFEHRSGVGLQLELVLAASRWHAWLQAAVPCH